MTETQPSRLYLLLPPRFEPEDMAGQLAKALAATPIACVRLDLGAADEEDWIRAANHVIEPCHAHDVALVVTDHYRLVDALGLEVSSETGGNGGSMALLEPVFPFWLKVDMNYTRGKTVTWRSKST